MCKYCFFVLTFIFGTCHLPPSQLNLFYGNTRQYSRIIHEIACKSAVNPNHLLIQEISRNYSSNSASLCKTDTLFVIYAHCVSWCKSLFYAQDAHAQTQSFTPTPLGKGAACTQALSRHTQTTTSEVLLEQQKTNR